jgi:cytochrome c-type biogenesis protein CcmH
LALNPDHPKALELAGSSEYQRGDYRAALRYWRPLLAALQPASQIHAELAAAIVRTERLAATTLRGSRP